MKAQCAVSNSEHCAEVVKLRSEVDGIKKAVTKINSIHSMVVEIRSAMPANHLRIHLRAEDKLDEEKQIKLSKLIAKEKNKDNISKVAIAVTASTITLIIGLLITW